VYLRDGSGEISVSAKALDDYFGGTSPEDDREAAFAITETSGKFDVTATVVAAASTAQASALRHGITKALCEFNIELRKKLKKAGLITRDARIKERKKYGQKGARARFQFSKR